jgi:hypothetical protein
MERLFANEYQLLNLIDNVSPIKEVREASNEAVTKLSEFEIEIK